MEQDNKPKKVIPEVETFTEDMVKVLEESQSGLVKKIIEEEEKNEIRNQNRSPQSRKNKFFLVISIILLISAVLLLAFLFFKNANKNITVNIPTPEVTPIIFTDNIDKVEVGGMKKDKIISSLLDKANQTQPTLKQNGVDAIYATQNGAILGLRGFMQLIESSFIAGDPNLINDQFLMGTVNNNSKNFFILIRVRSFVDIFSTMRSWESKMLSELRGFFGVDLTPNTNYLFTKDFEDGIVDNKNARILSDNSGNPVLMYIFADDQSVLITNSSSSAQEIVRRLAGSQVKK